MSTRYSQDSRCGAPYKNLMSTNVLDGLRFLIDRARRDGKKVVVMGNTAEFSPIEGKWSADHVFFGYRSSDYTANPPSFAILKDEADRLLFKQLQSHIIDYNKEVKAVADRHGAAYYNKVPLVCDLPSEICHAYTQSGFKTLYDYGHYTLEGAKFFGNKLAEDEVFRQMIAR